MTAPTYGLTPPSSFKLKRRRRSSSLFLGPKLLLQSLTEGNKNPSSSSSSLPKVLEGLSTKRNRTKKGCERYEEIKQDKKIKKGRKDKEVWKDMRER